MITLAEINNEIIGTSNFILNRKRPNDNKEKRQQSKEKNAAKKRIAYLKVIKNYIETNPSSEFVKQEIYRLTTAIDIHKNRFSISSIELSESRVIKEAKVLYEKENGIPKLRTQLNNLKFILKGK